jgi:hypothetical protein
VGEEVSLEPELPKRRASSKWTHMTLTVECVIDRPPGPAPGWGSGRQDFRCRADRIGLLAPGPHTWSAVGHCLVGHNQSPDQYCVGGSPAASHGERTPCLGGLSHGGSRYVFTASAACGLQRFRVVGEVVGCGDSFAHVRFSCEPCDVEFDNSGWETARPVDALSTCPLVARSRSNVSPVAAVASQHAFAATGLPVWVFRPVSSKLTTTDDLLKEGEKQNLRSLCMVKREEGDLSVQCAIFVFVPCLPPQ